MNKNKIYCSRYFPYIVTVGFVIVGGLLIYNHELWNDEVAHWNIALESSSIPELIGYMKDSVGHPFLWNVIIYYISHFISSNVESIKIVHFVFSIASCFLFLKYAPFNKTIRALFVFGYFPFYEYSIISRNYAIGLLPIIIFCVLYRNKFKNIIPISLTLFFMGQSHIHGFIISIVFLFMLIADLIAERKLVLKFVNKIYLLIAILIILSCLFLIYWELGSQATTNNIYSPTLDTMFDKSSEQIKQTGYLISKGAITALVPIPMPVLDFWFLDRNIVINFLYGFSKVYTIIVSIILIIIPIFMVKSKIIFWYLFGVFSLLAFNFMFYGNTLRHFGFVFLYTIACIWISSGQNNKLKYLLHLKKERQKIILNVFLITLLSSAIIGSSIAAYFDFRYPFSAGKQVAEYIEESFNEDEILIVGYKDADVQTIIAYMDKEIYLPQKEDFGRFVTNRIRRNDVATKDIFKQASALTDKNDIVLVVVHCNAVIDQNIPQGYLFKKLDIIFDEEIVKYENFCLYLFDKANNTSLLEESDFNLAEFENIKIPEGTKKIIIEDIMGKLKSVKIPVDLEAKTDYLIRFRIKSPRSLNGELYVDFFGNNYDFPDQEFSVKPDEIKEEYNQIAEIINSGNVPANEKIYLRIYTYAEGGAEIEDLEFFKINN